jgi:biopolymer transport protein TolQ
MNPADVAASAMAAPAAEVTLWSMFLSAHLVVKLVMIGLLGASIWCWAIIINKAMLFSKVQKAMDRFEQAFWSGNSLEELYATLSSRPTTGMASLFVAAMHEWKRSVQTATSSFMGLQTRIEKVLDVTIAREVEKLESHLLVLATVASAGPFIGLFGTVWGIMTSFRSIAASKNTSLAVVAPPTTSCRGTWRRNKPNSKDSPMNFPRSCRGKSISTARAIGRPEAARYPSMGEGSRLIGRTILWA